MTTTELIDLLKKHEFGGATGKPREINFEFRGIFIPTPSIVVDSTGDGLVTDICLRLDTEKLKTNDVTHGKWIKAEVVEQDKISECHSPYWKCSVCGSKYVPYSASTFQFCPKCGAKMYGDGE